MPTPFEAGKTAKELGIDTSRTFLVVKASAKEIRDARQEARRNYPELFTNMPQTNEKWWEAEEYLGAITNEDEARAIVPSIVSEAERRGYERAMEEVREAVIGTVRFTVDQGSEKEEDVDTWCIPKSFFAQPMTPQPEVTYTKQQAALINAVFQEAISSPDVSPDVATIINKSQKWLEKRTI